MANMDRENMVEDIWERFNALEDWGQRAVVAVMKAARYSIEEALDVVEKLACPSPTPHLDSM